MSKRIVKKHPFKRIREEEWRKLKAEASELFGIVEDGIWYPNERFIEEMHTMVLKEWGGHTGYEAGIIILTPILEEVKKAKDAYVKAAILLRSLIVSPRIYGDGNHRTALITTEIFLKRNGKKIYTTNTQETYKFIKDIM